MKKIKSIVAAVFILIMAAFCYFSNPWQTRMKADARTPPERGLNNLLNRVYGRSLLDEETLDRLWTVWDAEWKSKITDPNDKAQIRRITLERYGFTESVDPTSAVPLQFVKSEKGLVYSCMSCHGGRLPGSGAPMIGLPNTEIDMATFSEDLAKLAGKERKADFLQMTRGRTNAFTLSHSLLKYANEDMSMRSAEINLGRPENYDLDAPPWWNLKKKKFLYSDGFVEGGFSRAIMQFAMLSADGATFRSWETDFSDILAYLLSIQPPKYPWAIDERLAREGKKVFEQTCAQCHGTYGPGGQYPNRIVPIETIGTDSLRLTGLTKEFRGYYGKTWLAQNSKITENPIGYIAPPLDGIWASAPYFHNGSVPTVYGVLTEKARPTYFERSDSPAGYDQRNLGLKIKALKSPASPNLTSQARRRVVNTALPGLGNQGHPFGYRLSEKEKRQVIEYLKTL